MRAGPRRGPRRDGVWRSRSAVRWWRSWPSRWCSGIPLGIGLLLSIVLLSLLGVVVTAQTVGRVLIDEDRRPMTAFLAGWAIATVLGVIPYVSGVVYGGVGDLRAGCRDGGDLAGARPASRGTAGREASGGRRQRPGGSDREP